MQYRYQDLTNDFSRHPDYDGHAVHGMVDKDGVIVAAAFIHRNSRGICLPGGAVAKSGGGVRKKFPDAPFAEGLTDGLRLPRGMTQKFAGLDVPLGGGKSVIFGCNIHGWHTNAGGMPELPEDIWHEFLRAFGQEIMSHTRTYVVAEDMGTTPADMAYLARFAPRGLVAGCAQATNPSPLTARGLYMGIKAMIAAYCGSTSIPIKDTSFAIQGVGSVGAAFLDMIWRDGARNVFIADKFDEPIKRAKHMRDEIRVVHASSIYRTNAEIFVPCAGGGVLNKETISQLTDSMTCLVAGCANNQLATPEDGDALHEEGIAYAPDYIINAGGAAEVVSELMGTSAEEMLNRIPQTLTKIMEISDREDRPTSRVADDMVAARVALLENPL